MYDEVLSVDMLLLQTMHSTAAVNLLILLSYKTHSRWTAQE
jgi:hypothetical protein